ncbi:MAG: hypothetical protein BGO43_06110 [Gammaproteobacteria bacterium 39-13]|nr:MAG: hypothetical protein BGO43_06110 [Gammaproteobacteria bacterium 39-13]
MYEENYPATPANPDCEMQYPYELKLIYFSNTNRNAATTHDFLGKRRALYGEDNPRKLMSEDYTCSNHFVFMTGVYI